MILFLVAFVFLVDVGFAAEEKPEAAEAVCRIYFTEEWPSLLDHGGVEFFAAVAHIGFGVFGVDSFVDGAGHVHGEFGEPFVGLGFVSPIREEAAELPAHVEESEFDDGEVF